MKDIHRKVLQLRENGKTYPEIHTETGLAKSTISFIINKYFPKGKNQALFQKNQRKYCQSETFAAGQAIRRSAADALYEQQRQERKEAYLQKMRGYPDQGFIHYVAGLYAGEGNHHSKAEFSFSNSDPNLIRALLRFFREVLCIGEEGFSSALQIHTSLSREECVAFWEQECQHSIAYITQVDGRPQKKVHTHNKRRIYRGTLSVRAVKANGLKLALKEYEY